MATEQEQAEAVIDVFGEAYMALLYKRLRITLEVMPNFNGGKAQVTVSLVDVGNIKGPYIIDSHAISIGVATTIPVMEVTRVY